MNALKMKKKMKKNNIKLLLPKGYKIFFVEKESGFIIESSRGFFEPDAEVYIIDGKTYIGKDLVDASLLLLIGSSLRATPLTGYTYLYISLNEKESKRNFDILSMYLEDSFTGVKYNVELRTIKFYNGAVIHFTSFEDEKYEALYDLIDFRITSFEVFNNKTYNPTINEKA